MRHGHSLTGTQKDIGDCRSWHNKTQSPKKLSLLTSSHLMRRVWGTVEGERQTGRETESETDIECGRRRRWREDVCCKLQVLQSHWEAYLWNTAIWLAYLRNAAVRAAYLRNTAIQAAYLQNTAIQAAYLWNTEIQAAYLWNTAIRAAYLSTAEIRQPTSETLRSVVTMSPLTATVRCISPWASVS